MHAHTKINIPNNLWAIIKPKIVFSNFYFFNSSSLIFSYFICNSLLIVTFLKNKFFKFGISVNAFLFVINSQKSQFLKKSGFILSINSSAYPSRAHCPNTKGTLSIIVQYFMRAAEKCGKWFVIGVCQLAREMLANIRQGEEMDRIIEQKKIKKIYLICVNRERFVFWYCNL